MAEPKITAHTETVLRILLGRGPDGKGNRTALTTGLYGLELSRLTELPNGTLFPLLERLRQAGWVERYWEQDEIAEADGRPRRRFYKLTSKGAEQAPIALAKAMANTPSTARQGNLRLRPTEGPQ
jgi:DNA-binding MarR family transcriptional regulator